ncbi:MAG: hypothetical protein KDK66_00045 [Deltaproteobacteria bacterium]|nr:hypothetical protein [Deltaproteobacteria bacterium]
MSSSRREFLKSLIIPVSLYATVACSPAQESQKVAQSFVQSYYVDIDLPKAKGFTVALASDKIQQQEQLMQGLAPRSSADKPSVNFKLLSQEENQEEARYEYLIESSKETLQVLVKVRPWEGAWKVSMFSESARELPQED